MRDAHFHLGAPASGILCTSREEEWHLLVPRPGVVPSAGLLPDREGKALGKESLARLLDFLAQHPSFAVGEVGLDRRMPDPEGQEEFLRGILAFAREEDRLVTLHAVRADGALLSLLPPGLRFLWHGFLGSVETAKEIARRGGCFSLGPRTRETKLWRRIREIRDLPFLIESDGADGSAEEAMASFAREFASALGMGEKELEEETGRRLSVLTRKEADGNTTAGGNQA